MSACVLDASFTLQWVLEDESSPEGDAALALLSTAGAIVPAIWFVEITNALGMATRRGRMDRPGLQDALRVLNSVSLIVDGPVSLNGCHAVLDLMQTHRLTAYDATYLELAIRLGLPLATKDRELIAAAPICGVALFSIAA